MSIFDFFYNLKTSLLGAMSTTGIFSRLRAKLNSQQLSTKDIAALAEREEEATKKALNQSISDAVSEVLRKDEFTKAVAVQLASELQPSFQDLGSSAYNDKLQAHIETLKNRFDAQDTKLTHLSTILESNNSSSAEKICKIEEVVSSILKSQGECKESIKAVEERQTTQLTSIGTDLALFQENLITSNKKISDQLESTKSHISAETTPSISEINAQLNTISKTLELHSAKLGEIKDSTLSSEALTHIEASNELQTNQAAALTELKTLTERSFDEFSKVQSSTTTISSALDSSISQIDEIKTVLNEIKNTEINREILAETKTLNESLAAVTNKLCEIKSEILAETKASNESLVVVTNILGETKSEILAETKASNESLVVVTNTLGEIKSEILAETKASNESLVVVTNTLGEIKSEILAETKASNESLVVVTNTLGEIKSEILAETKASNESLVVVTNTLGEIKCSQSEISSVVSASNTTLESLSKTLPEEVKQAELNVIDNVKSISLSTSAQSQVIDDVKTILTSDVATTAGLTTLANSVETLRSSTETINASLDEILSTVSRPPPVAEKVDLSKLESSVETISGLINQIKAANELLLGEAHLAPVISTLNAHSTQLTDIKSTVLASAPVAEKFDLSSLESSVKDISSMFESQITSLNDLKTAVTALDNPQKIDLSGLESSIRVIIQTLESQKEALANSNTSAT